MAEETNEDVLAKAKAWHDDMLSVVPDAYGYEIPVPLMAAIIAELETVRAERDALRAAAQKLWKEVEFMDYHADMLYYRSEGAITQAELDEWEALEAWCKSNLTAALNTQPAPQAEWTPRLGDKVVVDLHHKPIGVIREVDEPAEAYPLPYRVEFGDGSHKWCSRKELINAD